MRLPFSCSATEANAVVQGALMSVKLAAATDIWLEPARRPSDSTITTVSGSAL